MDTSLVSDQGRPLLYVDTTGARSTQLSEIIAEHGWRVDRVDTFQQAHQQTRPKDYRVGIVHLEQVETADLLAADDLFARNKNTEWLLLTRHCCLDESDLCQLIHHACYDYYTLPLDDGGVSSLVTTLGHAYGMASLSKQLTEGHYDDYHMVGSSQSMLKLFSGIRKVAAVDAPVLIRGESGTGKELIARAVHERSSRAGKPFITVNCGALPEHLIQSELFGHEKGAFTGAIQRQIGRIEAADGGTLFLDEIGDLAMPLQVNLLRFLQEQVIQRVGSTKDIKVDVRVLAATHVDLDEAVLAKKFREDLLYRLNVLQLRPPALRDREGDIELLGRFFFQHFRAEGHGKIKGFSKQALQAMTAYNWPGNVREMINRVRRAVVMCEGRLVCPMDLGLVDGFVTRDVMSLADARNVAERQAIESALQHCRFNMSKAAKTLGVSRVTLYRLLAKYDIGFDDSSMVS
ncbi:sigma-54 dependent transcriptional regulator [Aliamphritea hakodatensis]|uniref:sigma-54 dependent transcriptional regulator n=1 Tax=Aliamphritea hakodatensis TaxID=2895352 RepID=UPI0022FD8E43|nr:sigma-54 dependent transcriptional regulator [Aliamphritea hakodatensis]